MRKQIWIGLLAFLLIFTMGLSMVMAAGTEFSADMSITDAKGKIAAGKVFIKGINKIRQEITVEGQASITILRLDKKLSWTLMPEQQMYMEMALPVNPNEPNPDYEYTTTDLGIQKINGYDCKGTKFTYKNKKYGELIQWISDKLQYSVKIEVLNSKGKITSIIEYSNIKQGPQPDSLFEVPANYQKFSMFPKM